MDAFIRHKHIGGLNAYRKPIIAAIGIALLIGILSYCQMLWIRFFSAQQRRRFAGCLDLFISPASEARFEPVVHLASAGG